MKKFYYVRNTKTNKFLNFKTKEWGSDYWFVSVAKEATEFRTKKEAHGMIPFWTKENHDHVYLTTNLGPFEIFKEIKIK